MHSTKQMSSIAAFVKTKRNELKLTQEDLSQKAGVGIRFIRELESSKETLKMDKINQVLRLFGHELGPVPISRDI